jgi:Domain of unknown function (DUF4412)
MKSAIIVAATLSLVTPVVSAADLTLVSKISGKITSVTTTYMTANAVRSNDTVFHFDSITDFHNGIIYIINHKAKTTTFTKMADVPGLGEIASASQPKGKGTADFNAGINDLYGDPAILKVENVGKDTVLGRSCNKTRITSGKLVWEYCMDPTLRSPVDPVSMMKAAKASFAGMAAYPRMAKVMIHLMEATSKLNGVALKTHMSGYNGDTYLEVTSIRLGPIPASTFALPTGYTMKDQVAETKKALAASHH